MFSIFTKPLGTQLEYYLQNNETGEFAAILPGYGATLNRCTLRNSHGTMLEVIDGCDTQEQLLSEGAAMYKGCVLFPFPNRVKDGKYSMGGNEFQIPVNHPSEGHALHMMLYNKPFKVISHEVDEFSASLIVRYDYAASETWYPFHFNLWVEFRLHATGGLLCAMNVQNTGIRTLPCGMGYHPYFRTGSPLDKLKLKLKSVEGLEHDGRNIPTTGRSLFTRFHKLNSLENVTIDNTYTLNERNVITETILSDPAQNYNIHVWQECGTREFSYVQVYTPPQRQSIAIEPMTCAPDAVNNGNGLALVSPGMWMEASWGIRVS